MARSYRQPYSTEQNQGKPARGLAKRAAARAVRAANKQAVRDAEGGPANGKAYRKHSDSWKIRDWSFYDPKARRK
jgi:hypothetical protein